MPAYNAQNWIAEAIDSVITQTVDDWELVVVDDGSTDKSAAIVADYTDARVRLLRQPNGGQSAAQNRGLADVRGEFVLFLDADDRLRPRALEHLVDILARRPESCLAYGSGTYISEAGEASHKKWKFTFSRKPSGNVLRQIVRRNFVAYTGAALIRKVAIDKVGHLRTDLVLAQDWEFWCRLATVGEFVFAGSEVVLEYRMHQGSVARLTGADTENQRAAIEAVFENPAIRKRLAKASLDRAQRARWADAGVFAATELMRAGQRRKARGELRRVLRLTPFASKAILLYLVTLPPTLPRRVRAHLGIL
jgi:glycosyltransferase involved in cell wall biosynthesis